MDWFGNRLLLMMFGIDHAKSYAKLQEICRKTHDNLGFFEWHTMQGVGQGSAFYTGSATTLARAIIEGLFGVEWTHEKIRIQPRLGIKKGYIYLPHAETGQFLELVGNKTLVNYMIKGQQRSYWEIHSVFRAGGMMGPMQNALIICYGLQCCTDE